MTTMAFEQYWLVCYDIEQSRQRSRANRLLRQYSLDYQKSGLETLLAGDIRGTLAALQPCIETSDALLLAPLQQPQPDWRLGNPHNQQADDTLIWS